VILLPFLALKLLVKSPRLLALGFFPGFFTLLASSVSIYFLWTVYLVSFSAWISYPVALLTFLLCWLAFGKIAMLPVEDPIIDEVQRLRLGSVVFPARSWSLLRILREICFGIFLGLSGIFVFVIGFFPVFSIFALIIASWISAYSFLAPIYDRRSNNLGERTSLFLRDGLANFLLGLLLNFLLFIPLVNVFLLGYAQVLATLVALRNEQALHVKS
jgi:uncharacterized protein involved in cysteine biosynthesis